LLDAIEKKSEERFGNWFRGKGALKKIERYDLQESCSDRSNFLSLYTGFSSQKLTIKIAVEDSDFPCQRAVGDLFPIKSSRWKLTINIGP